MRQDSSGMMATKAELILESRVGLRFPKGVPCEVLHEELTRGLEIKTKMSNTRSDLGKGGQEVLYIHYESKQKGDTSR